VGLLRVIATLVCRGRFGAKLVEGDSYLFSLTRYVHLNPVCIVATKKLPLAQRLVKLNSHRWSSYGGYVDPSKALDFVEYAPVRAMIDGRGEDVACRKYQEFVEAGIVQSDEEFLKLNIQGAERHHELTGDLVKPGFKREMVDKVLDEGGKLSLPVLMHSRVRYFSDGVIIGCKDFVERMFNEHSGEFSKLRRKRGANQMKGGEWGDLCAACELRPNVVAAPD